MLTPQVSRADSEPAPVVAPDALPALLARHAQDPRVEDIVREALAAYGADPTRLSSMASRARLRGLIPNVELGARRGQGMDLKPATSADVEGLRLSTDDNLVLEATLRFELGRLLFADDEVGIAREARAARSSRDDLVRQIVELYFKRKRLLLERDLRGSSDIDHEVRIAEAEALLDAFTNGAFRRMLVARKTAWTTDAPTHVTPSR
jgi:hypothetical protein